MPSKLKTHLVIWDDAFSISGWHGKVTKKHRQGYTYLSTGFIIKKTKTHLYLAQSVDTSKDSCFADVLVVPHGMIRKLKELK